MSIGDRIKAYGDDQLRYMVKAAHNAGVDEGWIEVALDKYEEEDYDLQTFIDFIRGAIPEFMWFSVEQLNAYLMSHWSRRIETTEAPPIECADGFSVSVQGGYGLYSDPRSIGPWTAVETGYPRLRGAQVAVEEWMDHAELPDYDQPPEGQIPDVYAYVPVELVVYVLNQHGGPSVKWRQRQSRASV